MEIACAAIVQAVPIILAALGGVVSERAGVVNFALEGMMLSGAFAAVWASYVTQNPWLGLAAALAAGVALAACHAAASLWLKVNQVVSSLAMNLLALGLTGALLWRVFGMGTSPNVAGLPAFAAFGRSWNVLVVPAFLLAPAVWALLRYTVPGLWVRAAGEDADAARAAGVNVTAVKFAAVLVSGALAGAAGACISIGTLTSFTAGMTGGRGYMAVAAVIFGKWQPLGAAAAALLFGAFVAAGEVFAANAALPEEVYLIAPYVLTLLALAAFIGKSEPPRALGKLPSR